MITRKEIIKLTKPVITKVLANVNSEKWYYDTKYIVNYNNNVYCANNKYVDIRITNYEPSKLNGATLFPDIMGYRASPGVPEELHAYFKIYGFKEVS